MTIVLLIKTEDGVTQELPLMGKTTIGRSSSSDFKIIDSKLSGTHGSFESSSQGQVIFTDLGSSNGSFLNNNKVERTVVKISDVITVGTTKIKIDEKRLSIPERASIGVAVHLFKEDKTLPEAGMTKMNMQTDNDMTASIIMKDKAPAEGKPLKDLKLNVSRTEYTKPKKK